MGYYHIRLRENTSKLFAIIPLWEKYCYKNLPMGVANSPEIFKQKMNDIFHGFEFICAYIYELLVSIKGYW